MKLPTLNKAKEAEIAKPFDTGKLAGIIGLWSKGTITMPKEPKGDSAVNDAAYRITEAKSAKALIKGEITREQAAAGSDVLNAWTSCSQAGCRFWLNTETGEASTTSPVAARKASGQLLGLSRRNLSGGESGATKFATTRSAPADEAKGTGSIVYDTKAFSELMDLLDGPRTR